MDKYRKDSFSGRKRFKTKTGICPLRDKMRGKGSVEFSRDLGSRKDRKQQCGEDGESCK